MLALASSDKLHPVDERLWRQKVVDLHQVMSTCRALFILLEQHDEAVVRTACELVLDKTSRKILWWEEGWWGEEEKREWFKGQVNEKLTHILAWVTGEQWRLQNAKEGADPEKLAALEAEVEEGRRRLRESEEVRRAAEERAKRAEATNGEVREKLENLERVCQTLRQQVRSLQGLQGVAEAEAEARRQSAELQRRLTEMEQAAQERGAGERRLSKRLAEVERELAETGQREAEAVRKLTTAGKEIEALRADLAKARAEAAELAQKVASQAQHGTAGGNAEASKKAIAQLEKQLADLQAEAEAERAKLAGRLSQAEERAKASEDRANALQAQVEELRAQLAEAQARAAAAERAAEEAAAAARAQHSAAPTVLLVPTGARHSAQPGAAATGPQEGELEEARRELEEARKALEAARAEIAEKAHEIEELLARIQKLEARLEKQKERITELTEERDKLEEQKMKLLRTLRDLRERMKQLQAIAERKGLGKAVADIMEESGLKELERSPEWSIFDRLYEDALRRQEKYKKMEEARGGAKPAASATSPRASSQEGQGHGQLQRRYTVMNQSFTSFPGGGSDAGTSVDHAGDAFSPPSSGFPPRRVSAAHSMQSWMSGDRREASRAHSPMPMAGNGMRRSVASGPLPVVGELLPPLGAAFQNASSPSMPLLSAFVGAQQQPSKVRHVMIASPALANIGPPLPHHPRDPSGFAPAPLGGGGGFRRRNHGLPGSGVNLQPSLARHASAAAALGGLRPGALPFHDDAAAAAPPLLGRMEGASFLGPLLLCRSAELLHGK